MVTGKSGTDAFLKLTDGDILYKGGEAAARQLPTFLGNHDMGRIGHMLDRASPGISEQERLARAVSSRTWASEARGVPTIYSGDEQGFTGDGGDQAAREDMFPSQVAIYNDNRLIGTTKTTAVDNFDADHPLYRLIADLAAVRAKLPELRRGATLVRAAGDKPGLLAFSRMAPGRPETLVLLNTAAAPVTANVKVDTASTRWASAWTRTGCPLQTTAPGSARVTLPSFGYAICTAGPAN